MEEVPTTPRRVPAAVRAGLMVVLLYGFLVGVKALEEGIGSFGEGAAEAIFASVSHPVAGVFAGLLATAVVQSSSATTSMIVGLVGAGVLTVPTAIPLVMGANIGTTITATLVSLGHLRRGPEFQRAFAGATMHDLFNLLSVAVLLPLELATGLLARASEALAGALYGASAPGAATGESPVKAVIAAPVEALRGLAAGWGDASAGVLLLVLGGVLIFTALAFITKNMRVVMAGRIEAALNTVLARGMGIGALLLGSVVTMLVQSSSITTSILVPMVAAGILSLENAYPVTLGANVGTTITAILASLAVGTPEALAIALAHTLFNLTGILLFYPVPAMRRIPIALARGLAAVASQKRRLVAAYILGVFVVLPLVGIAALR